MLRKCQNLRQKYTDEGFVFILTKANRFTRYFLLLNTDEPTLSGGQSETFKHPLTQTVPQWYWVIGML